MTTPVLDAFLRGVGGEVAGIDLEIDPRDQMYAFTLEGERGDADRATIGYLAEGRRACLAMLDVVDWRFGDRADVSVLDFASGYGRVTRHLVRELPAANVTISDVVADAVEFQKSRFGVSGIVSSSQPAGFVCSREFDLVFATSLFSHLPEASFRGWLGRLMDVTSDRGVLAFSVHDRSLLGADGESLSCASLFVPVSESSVLAGDRYGMMWVTESFVRDAVRAVAPSATCHRIPRGVGHFQDLYLVVHEPDADFSGLRYDCGPVGFIDQAVIDGGALCLNGWAVGGSPGGTMVRVELWHGGRPKAVAENFSPRPDVAAFLDDPGKLRSGWTLSIDLPRDVSFAEPVFVLGVSERGRTALFYGGSIDGLLRGPDSAGATSAVREGDSDPGVRAAPEVVLVLEQRIRFLEQTIEAMERSRFWKLRDLWFRLKGNPDQARKGGVDPR